MTVKRSDAEKTMVKYVQLEKNKLPFNINIINHYYYFSKSYSECKQEFLNKMPGFNDLRNEIVNDVIYIWRAASLPIISYSRIQTKLKDLVAKFERAKISKSYVNGVSEDWLDKIFDICKCKCEIPENPKIFNGKVSCSCSWEHRIPKEELLFLKDQRTRRKMILTSQKDMVYSRKKSDALNKQKRRINEENRSDQPTTSAISLAANETMIVPTKLRKLHLS